MIYTGPTPIVLVDLIYTASELYIDDIFVFGKDEDKFLKNLEAVFTRPQKQTVILKPKKTPLLLNDTNTV